MQRTESRETSAPDDASAAWDVFVSYAREDRAAAYALVLELERKGWRVWWDDRLRSGLDFGDAIDRALREVQVVIVLWSRASVDSDYVKSESHSAWNAGKLVPALIEDDVDIPVPFNTTHATPLPGWPETRDEGSLEKLFHAVSTTIREPRSRKRPVRMWAPWLLAASNAILLLWLLRTSFFYYETIVSVTGAALALLLVMAFHRSRARFAAEITLRRLFVSREGELRAPAVGGAAALLPAVLAGIVYVQPRFEISEIGPEPDIQARFEKNLSRHAGGVTEPNWLLLTLDTRWNFLRSGTLAIELKPYGEVQFADLQTEDVLNFVDKLGLPSEDGVIEIPLESVHGEARVRVRFKHGEYQDVPEGSRMVATLKAGHQTDHACFALFR